ncbi:hypothetical protein SH2C18_12480 [Clostridium sediminicola]|uniref:GGDEF domain-containing protein n=1 Tax=Clostridium sediminicola TaxID=3114879 RepID=UPI0031F261FB
MNKLFKPYFYSIVSISIALAIYSLFTESLIESFDLLSLIILLVTIFTEIMQLNHKNSISISLTGPFTIFAIIHKPLIFIYLMIIFYVLSSKLYLKFKSREHNRIFDMKCIYNISQYIILAKLVSIGLNLFTIESSILTIINILLLVIFDNILNIILTLSIISLFTNSNAFKEYKYRYLFTYLYYYSIILIILIYSYKSYNIWGLIFISLLILPLHGAILLKTSSHDINKKLITDTMTGAFNRNFLELKLKESFLQGTPFTLLFLDLDEFKKINDLYGHVIGDAVLIDFVCQLKKYLRRDDNIFRYGGDEFCVMLSNKGTTSNLIDSFKNQSFNYRDASSNTKIKYSFSYGSFNYSGEDNIDFNELIHKVDKKMYMCKKNKSSN